MTSRQKEGTVHCRSTSSQGPSQMRNANGDNGGSAVEGNMRNKRKWSAVIESIDHHNVKVEKSAFCKTKKRGREGETMKE